MVIQIPSELADEDGKDVRIHRAWPRGDGSLIVEGRELESGRVRAGRIAGGGRASMVPFGEDRALLGLNSAAPNGDLLVHRLKRRAVVRSGGQYRKFIAGRKASDVTDAHLAAAAGLAGSGLEVPDVVTSDGHSVTLTAVPGLSLHDLGRRLGTDDGTPQALDAGDRSASLDRWSQAWELWAFRWPKFARAAANTGALIGSRHHTAMDEARTVARWIELAISFGSLGVPEDRLRSASESVARSLLAGTSPMLLAHRDLHDKQVLIDADTGSVGIIDCDTLAMAEPALDLANLSVHLDFRVAQGLLSTRAAALGKQHIREAAETLQVPEARFEAYASATAIRLACIYAFRPPYRETARIWFSEVAACSEPRMFPVPRAF